MRGMFEDPEARAALESVSPQPFYLKKMTESPTMPISDNAVMLLTMDRHRRDAPDAVADQPVVRATDSLVGGHV